MLYHLCYIQDMDDLDRHIAETEKANPGFTSLVDAAQQRRAYARKLAAHRKERGLSQTKVAAMMSTSQSIVARVERGSDVKLSTLEKYMAAIGHELPY